MSTLLSIAKSRTPIHEVLTEQDDDEVRMSILNALNETTTPIKAYPNLHSGADLLNELSNTIGYSWYKLNEFNTKNLKLDLKSYVESELIKVPNIVKSLSKLLSLSESDFLPKLIDIVKNQIQNKYVTFKIGKIDTNRILDLSIFEDLAKESFTWVTKNIIEPKLDDHKTLKTVYDILTGEKDLAQLASEGISKIFSEVSKAPTDVLNNLSDKIIPSLENNQNLSGIITKSVESARANEAINEATEITDEILGTSDTNPNVVKTEKDPNKETKEANNETERSKPPTKVTASVQSMELTPANTTKSVQTDQNYKKDEIEVVKVIPAASDTNEHKYVISSGMDGGKTSEGPSYNEKYNVPRPHFKGYEDFRDFEGRIDRFYDIEINAPITLKGIGLPDLHADTYSVNDKVVNVDAIGLVKMNTDNSFNLGDFGSVADKLKLDELVASISLTLFETETLSIRKWMNAYKEFMFGKDPNPYMSRPVYQGYYYITYYYLDVDRSVIYENTYWGVPSFDFSMTPEPDNLKSFRIDFNIIGEGKPNE